VFDLTSGHVQCGPRYCLYLIY